jgi:hypothetical protein
LTVTFDGTNYYWNATQKNFTASAGGATFTTVERQNNANSGCASPLTVTLGTNTTAGEAIFAYYSASNPTGSVTVSDSASDTFTTFGQLSGVATHDTIGIAYLLGTASGLSTVTLTAAGSNACRLVVEHVKRSAGSWAVDQSNPASATGKATPWASGTVTTTVANEYLIGGVEAYHASGGNCALAASGSWTGHNNGTQSTDIMLLDQAVTSIQTNIAATGTTATCATFGGAGNYPEIITFK